MTMVNRLATEEVNPKTSGFDALPVDALLRVMNEEDALVPLAVREALPAIEQVVNICIESLNQNGRVIYVGAGTSGRLALLDAAEVVPTFGMPEGVFLVVMAGGSEASLRAVEQVEDSEEAGARDIASVRPTKDDVVIGISASGRTPYVKAALRKAGEFGAKTALICNVSVSPVARFVDVVIAVRTGPEVVCGSTRLKAGTAQKLVLNMISTATMAKLGRVFGNHMVCLKATNEKLRRRAVSIVTRVTGVTDEEASRSLAEAGQDVKLAILMSITGVTKRKCAAVLKNRSGNLRAAIKALEGE
jgi:N-acetylmuramic acid 6-phosphate etherase